jgi:transcriptional regulator with XRE-family HTH domain|tara:strand:- start:459 stop:662 length:204 start_codon:yes stop_codon:yes gene_type:complete
MQILKEILKENNFSQVQLAKNLEISVSLLSNIMNFKRSISKPLMIKLHNKYNIDYETLLGVNANEKR